MATRSPRRSPGTPEAHRPSPLCRRAILTAVAVLGSFVQSTLQDVAFAQPTPIPSGRNARLGGFWFPVQSAGLHRTQLKTIPSSRRSEKLFSLRASATPKVGAQLMTRRGVLVLGPLAALAVAGWESRDKVAAETEKAKEKAATASRPLRKELTEARKELEKEKKLISADLDAGLKELEQDLAEQQSDVQGITEEDVSSFKERYDERKKGAMDEIDQMMKELDAGLNNEELQNDQKAIKDEYMKKKSDLVNELKAVADKVEDPQVKEKLLSDAADLKAQSLDSFSLKQWTEDSMSDARERLGGVLLRNEELLRRVDEVVPLQLLTEDVKGDSVVLTFPLLGGMSVVKKTITIEQVARTGLVAGAEGELIKDVVSFPLDTIRTRLMTQGSFEAHGNSSEADAEAHGGAAGRGGRAVTGAEAGQGTQRVERRRVGRLEMRVVKSVARRVGRQRFTGTVRTMSVPAGLIRGVYKGVTAVLLASPLQGAAFFGAKELIKKAAPMYGLSAMQTFLAGIVVGDAVYWVVRCPAETIKTRVQTGIDPDWWTSLRNIVEKQGLGGLYGAYVPLLQLDFPFTAVNFALYSGIQAYVEAANDAPPTVSQQFAIGFLCSAFTAALTTPLSVATTRILMESGGRSSEEEEEEGGAGGEGGEGAGLQGVVEEQRERAVAFLSGKAGEGHGEAEREEAGGVRTLLKAPQRPGRAAGGAGEAGEAGARGEGSGRKYVDMAGTVKTIYAEEGALALIKGVLPRMAQLGLNHALRFSAYDAARKSMVSGFLDGSLL